MDTWARIYRDHEVSARLRLNDIFVRARQAAGDVRGSAAAAVHHRRYARAWAGIAGSCAGAVLLVQGALSHLADPEVQRFGAHVLGAGLLTTAVIYALARLEAGARLRRGLRALVRHSNDPHRDLARLEETPPADLVRRMSKNVEVLSFAAPLVAVSLLGPLTLHALVYFSTLTIGEGASLEPAAGGFGQWVALSALAVGHAHVVAAWLSARFAKRLLTGQEPTALRPALKVLGLTTLAATVPGIILLAIPPILTAVTGVFLVFPMFVWAHRTAGRERAVLELG